VNTLHEILLHKLPPVPTQHCAEDVVMMAVNRRRRRWSFIRVSGKKKKQNEGGKNIFLFKFGFF